MAEHYISKKINELVISVPANYNDSQRVLTKQAAELAGLRVIRIINEPTAAALAYYYNETLENNKNILVLDFGGGFFEVSKISLKKNEKEADFKEFEVLGTSGAKLGGKDFDNKLVDYFLNELENKDSIKKNKQCIQKLKINCEIIKKCLSQYEEATLCIEDFYDGTILIKKITRTQFEDICDDLFKKMEAPLENELYKMRN